MRRRELVLLLGGAMMTARTLRAQQKAMPVIGYLESGAAGASAPLSITSMRRSVAIPAKVA